MCSRPVLAAEGRPGHPLDPCGAATVRSNFVAGSETIFGFIN
jgi:hypothetical protein